MIEVVNRPGLGSGENAPMQDSDTGSIDRIPALEAFIRKRNESQPTRLTETQVQIIAATALNLVGAEGFRDLDSKQRAKYICDMTPKILCIAASLDHPTVHREQHAVAGIVTRTGSTLPSTAKQHARSFWTVVGYDGDLSSEGSVPVEVGMQDALRFLHDER